MVELLAPVGSQEALVAAVESGADAIYLSGKMFGARAYAPNFTDEELAEAVRFAHLRNVVVYVTVNTLVDDTELETLAEYLKVLYQVGVDAIIVQDLGVAALAKQVVPDLPLHASTQMTVYNLEGVEFLRQQGFSRVVLAREVTLEEIAYICQNTDTEIEVFVHGALCISYSGQCLMSSMIGGRSGNRGRCAQPCRLPYTLVDQAGNDCLVNADAGNYLLSPRDLNTLELLPELIAAGVTSFKMEGRMKRAEYVAVVTDTYRRAIDSCLHGNGAVCVSEQDQKDIAQIFNRDFTTAYLERKQGRMMMSDRRPNNRGVRLGRVIQYHPTEKRVTLKLDEVLYRGDIIDFWVKVGGRVSVTVDEMTVHGQVVEEAAPGTEVTLAIPSPVRGNDRVFKVFDTRVMERARQFLSKAHPVRRIPLTVEVQAAVGKPLLIRMTDAEGFNSEAVTQFIGQEARNRPLNEDTVRKQIERLGTTIFSLETLHCTIEGNVMVPVSEMNEARRQAVEQLEAARLARFQRPPLSVGLLQPRQAPLAKANTQVAVQVDSLDKVEAALRGGADYVYFGGERFGHQPLSADMYRAALSKVREAGKKIYFSTPRIVKAAERHHVEALLALFEELRPDGVLVANLGIAQLTKQLTTLPLYGDYPLNNYNYSSLRFWADQGMKGLALSPELNFAQVEQLVAERPLPLECVVHGYLTLMVSEYCAIGSFLGGLHKGACSQPCTKGSYWLKDRKDVLFPVTTDQFCRMHILNSKELSMLPHVPRFKRMGIERIRIEGKQMEAGQVQKIVRLYCELLEQGERHALFQHDRFSSVEHEDITRGHYFRGVL